MLSQGKDMIRDFELTNYDYYSSRRDMEIISSIVDALNKILEDTILSRFMKETIKIYKATDGSIRFAFGYKNIEKAYFEITEKEYNSLMTLK